MEIENNSLVLIILAFIIGYYLPQLMQNMCGNRLIEGNSIFAKIEDLLDSTNAKMCKGGTFSNGVCHENNSDTDFTSGI